MYSIIRIDYSRFTLPSNFKRPQGGASYLVLKLNSRETRRLTTLRLNTIKRWSSLSTPEALATPETVVSITAPLLRSRPCLNIGLSLYRDLSVRIPRSAGSLRQRIWELVQLGRTTFIGACFLEARLPSTYCFKSTELEAFKIPLR